MQTGNTPTSVQVVEVSLDPGSGPQSWNICTLTWDQHTHTQTYSTDLCTCLTWTLKVTGWLHVWGCVRSQFLGTFGSRRCQPVLSPPQVVTTAGCSCGTWRRPSTLAPSRWSWRESTCPTSSAWPSTAPTGRSSLVVRAKRAPSHRSLLQILKCVSALGEDPSKGSNYNRKLWSSAVLEIH